MGNSQTIGNNPSLADILPALPHGNQSHAYFDSPESLVSFVESHDRRNAWENTAWDAPITFAGNRDMPTTFRMVREGWPEGAAKIARMRDKIIVENPQRHEYARWYVAGAYPSVPRAVAGNPQHMRRKSFADTHKRPVITIAHHCGGTISVKPDTFSNKAAVVAAIIDVIEDSGYSVELIACSASANHATPISVAFVHETAVVVKRAGDSVDIGRMAFAIGHSGFFRRLVFACRGIDPFNKPLGSSLGVTCDYPEIPTGLYVLPSLNTCEDKFSTEQAAVTTGLNFYLDTLARQGCPCFANRLGA